MLINSKRALISQLNTVLGYVIFFVLSFILLEILFGATVHAAQSSSHLQYKIKKSADHEQLTIILESNGSAKSIKSIVSANDGTLRYSSGNKTEIKVSADKAAKLLSRLPSQFTARLSYPHAASSISGQGVALTNADDVHAYGADGAGIKIGIIDLGFANLASSQSSGDLPATGFGLNITDYTGNGTGGLEHGINVAEIVHEMAPGAELYLAKISTDVQLDQAVKDMINAGVSIINHSINWFGAAFYDGTGSLCNISNTAETGGALWVNSVGNYRNRHYLATFTDVAGNHEFASGQSYNAVSLTSGVEVSFTLNWDAYPATSVDYDFFLYDGIPGSGGSIVASSQNPQSGTIPFQFPLPYEYITYTPAGTGTYYLVVSKAGATTTELPLTIFSPDVDLTVVTQASSLAQPADCDSAMAISATDAVTDIVLPSSSMGPSLATAPLYAKPDMSAPSNVQTSLNASFTGTSSASAHVSGGAAVLMRLNPSMTIAQIRNLLTVTAVDLLTAGYDDKTGFGRLSIFTLDLDVDGINNDTDNCPIDTNVSQLDTDLDGQGNECDSDDDNDGLSDALEISLGTDPLLIDTDNDGLTDFYEVNLDGNPNNYNFLIDTNPNDDDSDNDGTIDGLDAFPKQSAEDTDTDADGIGNNADTDDDNDGLSDTLEAFIGTDPLFTDTDNDGLSDYAEVSYDGDDTHYTAGLDTDPNNDDTDGDGLLDGVDGDPLVPLITVVPGDVAPVALPDGVLNAADYLVAMRIVLDEITPTAEQLANGDVYPPGSPDGVIDISDLILIQKLIQP